MIFTGTEKELGDFITDINKLHKTFKFTYEYSVQSITYLDLVIYKGLRYKRDQILDTRTHTKDTDTFQYLAIDSCHPKSTFKGLIKGEFLRYARTCNNKHDFNTKANFFTLKLQKRGYKKQEIIDIYNEVEHENRFSYLQNKAVIANKKLLYVTTYSPHIKTSAIKRALTLNWEMIENNQFLRSHFPEKPTIAYRRNPNLKDILVRSKINTEKNMQARVVSHDKTEDNPPMQSNERLITDNVISQSDMNTTGQGDPNISLLASLLEEQYTYCE